MNTIKIGVLSLVLLVFGLTFFLISRVNLEAPAVTDSVDTKTQSMSTPTEANWYEIPELGIRFQKVDERFSDVTHTIKLNDSDLGTWTDLSFSTKQMESLDPYCASKYSPLGTLSIRSQDEWELEKTKQLDSPSSFVDFSIEPVSKSNLEYFDVLENRKPFLIGNDIFVYFTSQAPCWDSSVMSDPRPKNFIQDIIKTLEPIPK